jgi:hypothetical protein
MKLGEQSHSQYLQIEPRNKPNQGGERPLQ